MCVGKMVSALLHRLCRLFIIEALHVVGVLDVPVIYAADHQLEVILHVIIDQCSSDTYVST